MTTSGNRFTKQEPLAVSHDPGRSSFWFGALALAITGALWVPLYIRYSRPRAGAVAGEAEILLVGASIGVLFWIGWIVRAARTRKRKQRTYRLDGTDIVCSSGIRDLWREPARAAGPARGSPDSCARC